MSTFKPRLVECLLRREGGTVIPFDTCSRWPKGRYHFKPGTMVDGRHSAEINVVAHYERLISVPEAYRPVHPDDLIRLPEAPPLAPAAPAVVTAAAPAATVTSDSKPDPDDKGDSADDTSDVWNPVNVLALGVDKISTMATTYSDEQIRQLIQLEGEREDPRQSLVKRLTATLRGRAE